MINEIDITSIEMEDVVLQNLIEKPTYNKAVIPYLNSEHFSSVEHQTIFNSIVEYNTVYNTVPNKKELIVYIKNNKKIQNKILEVTLPLYKKIYSMENNIENFKFLLDKTEEFIRLKEFKKYVLLAATSVQNNNSDVMNTAVDALEKVLQITFDDNLGTSFDDIDDTIEHFHRVMDGLTTGISSLDKMLGGGFYKNTLNVFAAITHGGKSLIMSSIASHLLLVEKKDILFITLEMPEKEVLKRIYANVLNIDVNTFKSYSKEELKAIHQKVVDQGLGNLIVKEYPTGTLSTNMLRGYVDKYVAKFKKMPDVIMVDYLTIMKANSMNENTSEYVYYKKVAEEVRALAMELDLPIVTAAQLNRSGFASGKEAGLDAVSSSLGIAMTCDWFGIISRTPEMDALGQVYLGAKKNRNTGDLSQIIIGIEWSRMRFYGLDPSQTTQSYSTISNTNNTRGTHGTQPNNTNAVVQPVIQPSYSKSASEEVTNVFGNTVDFDF